MRKPTKKRKASYRKQKEVLEKRNDKRKADWDRRKGKYGLIRFEDGE